ncbi:hypothetical protein CUMW_269280 [Citrus unshiu]|nr:hypothetical protein CUMW_269280 [Citrus unshiu]
MADSREFIQKVTCGAAVIDAPLYDEARLCPDSLKYYGFCLQNGNYNVSLYFSEIVFAKNDDYSSSAKRVFDIYIQRELRRKDFNIKEMARHSNNVTIQNFTASVHEHLLEIELFWAGKGSLYNPPYFHGPLISAISVTPNFQVNRPGGLSKIGIVGIVLGAVLALILFLALMWRLGWIGDRELRVTTVNLRGKSYTLKQVKVATRNFSPRNAELPDQTAAVKMLSSQSKQVIDQIGTEVYALKTLKHENIVEFLDGYSKKDLNLLIYEYMEKGSLERALFVWSHAEYVMRKAITEKVDVFSFGIVLLEIISGRTNAKYEANQETEFLLDTGRRQLNN